MQFFTDFREYVAGQAPEGWTEQWNPSGASALVLPAGPTGGSGPALRISYAASSRYALSWDAVGAPSGDVEVVARLYNEHTVDANDTMRVYLHGSGSAGAENAYFGSLNMAADVNRIDKYLAGTPTTIATAAAGASVNTWYWIRVQRTGTTIRAKFWTLNEPTTWTLTTTDSDHSSGWVGLGGVFNAGHLWVDQIGVGTGGDAAPMLAARQYFTNFYEYVVGAQPSDWTERWTIASGTPAVQRVGLPAGAGVAALQIQAGTNARYMLSWNVLDGTNGDVNVLMRALSSHTADLEGALRIYLHGSGAAATETGYYASLNGVTDIVQAVKYSAGAATVIGQTAFTSTFNVWYWLELERTGTTVRARVWADGAARPGWQVSGTDADLSGGWVGIGELTSAGTLWVSQFGVGVGGAPAPASALPDIDGVAPNYGPWSIYPILETAGTQDFGPFGVMHESLPGAVYVDLAGALELALAPSAEAALIKGLAGSLELGLTPSAESQLVKGLAGSLTLEMTPSGEALVIHALAGTLTLQVGPDGDLGVTRTLAGSIQFELDPGGIFETAASQVLAGQSALELEMTGDLSVMVELAGTLSLELEPDGAATVTRALTGTLSFPLDPSGALSEVQALSGTLELELEPTGDLTSAGEIVYVDLDGTLTLVYGGGATLSLPGEAVIIELNGILELALEPVAAGYVADDPYDPHSPGGGLSVESYPFHWANVREGQNLRAVLPYAGIRGRTVVLRCLSRTFGDGMTEVELGLALYPRVADRPERQRIGPTRQSPNRYSSDLPQQLHRVSRLVNRQGQRLRR